MRKKLLLAIAFALGVWAYLLMGAAAPRRAPAAPAMGAEDGIAAYFSPGGGCTSAVVAQIEKATQTIDVQAYLFTSPPIAQAITQAYDRGVRIRVVLDKSQKTGHYSSATYLLNHHVPVYIDDQHALAHNKVMLLDGQVLITGSFNFTKSAEENNAENLLIIRDRPKLIAAYQANFDRHFNHSMPYAASGK
ncbi:MAG TPA: phospholipase D family protein [Tepidisphaeraceae bacterium]|nr:phospholipase D family protein [Tepidisphaeraceae bacterium]